MKGMAAATALAIALAMAGAAPGHAFWKNAGFVDWVKKAKGELKNSKCWKNPFNNKC